MSYLPNPGDSHVNARAVGGAPSVDPRVTDRIKDILCSLAGYGSDRGYRAAHLRDELETIFSERRRAERGIPLRIDLPAECHAAVEAWIRAELAALETEIAEGLRLARAL